MPGDFTDLLAWQEATALATDVHELVRKLQGVGAIEAAEQMVRAAESISANIAEGYGRGPGRDNCRFIRIAIGSAAELEDRLLAAVRNRRVAADAAAPTIQRTRRVRALTTGLLHWHERKLKRQRA